MYNTYIYISSHEVGGTGSLHPHFPCPYWSTPHEFDGQQLTTAQNFRMTTAEFLVHDHNVGRWNLHVRNMNDSKNMLIWLNTVECVYEYVSLQIEKGAGTHMLSHNPYVYDICNYMYAWVSVSVGDSWRPSLSAEPEVGFVDHRRSDCWWPKIRLEPNIANTWGTCTKTQLGNHWERCTQIMASHYKNVSRHVFVPKM